MFVRRRVSFKFLFRRLFRFLSSRELIFRACSRSQKMYTRVERIWMEWQRSRTEGIKLRRSTKSMKKVEIIIVLRDLDTSTVEASESLNSRGEHVDELTIDWLDKARPHSELELLQTSNLEYLPETFQRNNCHKYSGTVL